MSVLSWLLFLLVAGACASLAAAVVPGRIPGGCVANVIVGLIGAWVGNNLIGQVGPELAGVSLLPTLLGSATLVFGLALLWGRRGR